MRKLIIGLSAVIMVMSAFSSQKEFKSGIQGTIEPPEGVKKIWAISGTDTMSTIPVTGKFLMDVKAGNWKIYVESVQPYKNTVVESVLVVDNQYTDVGVIKLPS
jgi:hypothetical protein